MTMDLGPLGRTKRGQAPARRRRATRDGLAVEVLEARALLTGLDPQAHYVVSGSKWPNPSHITFSFVPDGVSWDSGTNNLNAVMNARFGSGAWQRELARALQTWASVANLNFVQVSDAGLPFDTPGLAQGDPRFGDIRIGGFPFDQNTLAQTFYPPPDGQTAPGDTEINTALTWSMGSGTDLYSAMLHEFGHALGMDHSHDPSAVMNAIYGGVRTGLTPDDIAGIQSIYGARLPDLFQGHGQATSFSTALDLTSQLDGAWHDLVSGVELASIGDVEYFSVVAPPAAGPGARLSVTAAASGVSLLSPSVTVYNALGSPITSNGNPAAYGDDAQAVVPITASQRYYLAVTGATHDVFATGAYQLRLGFTGIGAPPAVTPPPPPPPPPAMVRQPPPIVMPAAPFIGNDRFEPNNTLATATPLGPVVQTIVGDLTLTLGDTDVFAFQAARAGVYLVEAPGTELEVVDARGRLVAAGAGVLTFRAGRSGTHYDLVVTPPAGRAVPDYGVAIALQARQRVVISPRRFPFSLRLGPAVGPAIAHHGRPALG